MKNVVKYRNKAKTTTKITEKDMTYSSSFTLKH